MASVATPSIAGFKDGELDHDLDDTPVAYGPRRPTPTKLDSYRAIIETRLAAYPVLSAVRLLEGIRAAGYTGGYSQLKAFVRRPGPRPVPFTCSTTCSPLASEQLSRPWFPR